MGFLLPAKSYGLENGKKPSPLAPFEESRGDGRFAPAGLISVFILNRVPDGSAAQGNGNGTPCRIVGIDLKGCTLGPRSGGGEGYLDGAGLSRIQLGAPMALLELAGMFTADGNGLNTQGRGPVVGHGHRPGRGMPNTYVSELHAGRRNGNRRDRAAGRLGNGQGVSGNGQGARSGGKGAVGRHRVADGPGPRTAVPGIHRDPGYIAHRTPAAASQGGYVNRPRPAGSTKALRGRGDGV